MNYEQPREIFDATAVSVIATILNNPAIGVSDLQSLARVTTAITDNPSIIQSPAHFLNHIRQMHAELRAKIVINEDQQTFHKITDYLIRKIRDVITPSVTTTAFEEYFGRADAALDEDFDNNDPFA